jgi:hypothetical protein
MSKLGSLSGHLDREEQRLRDLNWALLTLEANTLGKTAEFGVDEVEVERSRQVLLDFAQRLQEALSARESTEGDMQSLVVRIRSGMKPLDDWREDLERLVHHLQTSVQVSDDLFPVLEDILSLLDTEFAEDLRRLYAR